MILRHMQTAKDWHIEDNERGKKLTIFPTEGRKERGGRDKGWTCLKMKQISLTLNSDYSVVKIQLTSGLDNYPDQIPTPQRLQVPVIAWVQVSG